jgi:hypothetical protein
MFPCTVDNSGWPHLFDAFMKKNVEDSKECSELMSKIFWCKCNYLHSRTNIALLWINNALTKPELKQLMFQPILNMKSCFEVIHSHTSVTVNNINHLSNSKKRLGTISNSNFRNWYVIQLRVCACLLCFCPTVLDVFPEVCFCEGRRINCNKKGLLSIPAVSSNITALWVYWIPALGKSNTRAQRLVLGQL